MAQLQGRMGRNFQVTPNPDPPYPEFQTVNYHPYALRPNPRP